MSARTFYLYLGCIMSAVGAVALCHALTWRHAGYAFGYGLYVGALVYLALFARQRRAARRAR